MIQPDKYDDDEKMLKRYKDYVRWAESDQKSVRDEGNNFLSYYRNRPKVHTRGGQEVTVPIGLKNVDAMFAALTAFQVSPVVAPKGETTYVQVQVMDQALKNEWDECEVIKTTRPAIKDGLIVGIGYAKVWYEFAESERELDETEEADEISANFSQLVREANAEGEDYDPDELAELAKITQDVEFDGVTVDYIPWDEIYFDPEAKRWEDVRWVCHTYEVPLEDVLNDDTIPESAKENLSRDTLVSTKWRTHKDSEADIHEERVVLRDMYDLETGFVCTFSLGHDKLLKKIPNPLAGRYKLHQRNPFKVYIERSDPGNVVGISTIKAMKPSIDQANIDRSNLTTFVDRFKTKLTAEEDSMDDAAKRAAKSQEHGEIIFHTTGTAPPRALDLPALPSEAWALDGKAIDDANESVAINELLQGQLPQGRKSATAMNMLGESSSVRQSEKRNGLEDFYVAIADTMLYLMQMFYEKERITRMVDVEQPGDVVWEWNNEDIITDVSTTVALEQREIQDTASKLERAAMMLNVFGARPSINQTNLDLYLLRDFGVPAEIRRELVKTEEQAAQEAQAGVEQEMMMAQAQAAATDQGAPPVPESPFPGNITATTAVPPAG